MTSKQTLVETPYLTLLHRLRLATETDPKPRQAKNQGGYHGRTTTH